VTLFDGPVYTWRSNSASSARCLVLKEFGQFICGDRCDVTRDGFSDSFINAYMCVHKYICAFISNVYASDGALSRINNSLRTPGRLTGLAGTFSSEGQVFSSDVSDRQSTKRADFLQCTKIAASTARLLHNKSFV
jgi:hypothetical protein